MSEVVYILVLGLFGLFTIQLILCTFLYDDLKLLKMQSQILTFSVSPELSQGSACGLARIVFLRNTTSLAINM